ncbi:MAG: biotin/lipoyl-containing protein [Gemmatimonadales bacterium]
MKYVVAVAGRELEVEVDGDRVTVAGRSLPATLAAAPATPVRQLLLDGRAEALAVESLGGGRWALTLRGERHEVEVVDERTRHIRSLTGGADRGRGPGVLRAPMPGLVVRVQAQPGQAVTPGSGLVVLEAMKMENELRSSAAAVVRAVRVAPGEAVEKGQVLVEFDPSP